VTWAFDVRCAILPFGGPRGKLLAPERDRHAADQRVRGAPTEAENACSQHSCTDPPLPSAQPPRCCPPRSPAERTSSALPTHRYRRRSERCLWHMTRCALLKVLVLVALTVAASVRAVTRWRGSLRMPARG